VIAPLTPGTCDLTCDADNEPSTVGSSSPWIPAEQRRTLEGYRAITGQLNVAETTARAAGRRFAYHNQAGIRHCFAEHDEPADAFASIRASYDYLTKPEF